MSHFLAPFGGVPSCVLAELMCTDVGPKMAKRAGLGGRKRRRSEGWPMAAAYGYAAGYYFCGHATRNCFSTTEGKSAMQGQERNAQSRAQGNRTGRTRQERLSSGNRGHHALSADAVHAPARLVASATNRKGRVGKRSHMRRNMQRVRHKRAESAMRVCFAFCLAPCHPPRSSALRHHPDHLWPVEGRWGPATPPPRKEGLGALPNQAMQRKFGGERQEQARH